MSQVRASITSLSSVPSNPATDSPRRGNAARDPEAIAAPAKIVIATINPLVGNTGVQTHTRSLHDGLIADGVSCVIQTAHAGHPWWLAIFAIRRIFGPIDRSWSTRWHRRWHAAALRAVLGRLLDRQGADAVLAQCPVSAAVALEVRDRLGLNFPVVMACHFNYSEAREYRDKGELADEASYQQILAFEEQVLREVDRVIYVSGWARRVVEQERKIKVRAASVIWNGIAADPCVRPISRSELGLSTEDLVMINVGTLEKRKNQVGLVDLFADIAREWPNAKLLLVGDGPQRALVRRRIEERNLSSKILLLGTRRDVPALLPAADLYVHYSAVENCPVVLIEAARASLPIVAVPGGGAAELLAALGGLALDSGNNAASLNTLRPLMTDAAERRRAGTASRAAFERSFTREAMVGEYLKAMQMTVVRETEAGA